MTLGLCLLMALTSQTMAVARGAASPVGTMVLCTGTGPVTVMVDANGQPTGTAHICPDCALGLFHALAPAPLGVPHLTEASALEPFETTSEIGHVARAAFRARAPPLRA
ncbi:hypothetical protein [uncultured Roseovarius sp.]|uniref:hypothetical protein n=1 Tax=Roseovarius sp. TaxID=1486281 RepID=UPI0025DF3171|nr:hypothetical protein [uncultured Roseovarius sp.]